jgi:hypothetical protein
MKRSTQIVIAGTVLAIGTVAVAVNRVRAGMRTTATHSCVASINARLRQVTNAIIATGAGARAILSYDEAKPILQAMYGQLDCGCYDANRVPCDSWGQTIVVAVEGPKEPELRALSLGPDGKFGTSDDIR